MGLSSPRSSYRTDGKGLPGTEKGLPAERDQPGLLGKGQRMPLYGNKALRLVPWLSYRRPLADVGPPELSLERPGFRGQCQRGDRRRLADPIQGYRSLV